MIRKDKLSIGAVTMCSKCIGFKDIGKIPTEGKEGKEGKEEREGREGRRFRIYNTNLKNESQGQIDHMSGDHV